MQQHVHSLGINIITNINTRGRLGRCREVREARSHRFATRVKTMHSYAGAREYVGCTSWSDCERDRRGRILVLPNVSQTHDRANGVCPDDAVGRIAGVQLELPGRSLCERSEDSIRVTAREAQSIQCAL